MQRILYIFLFVIISNIAGAQSPRELNAAITAKDLAKVKSLLAAGVSPSEPFKSVGGDYVSPFILAVQSSTPEIAELMFKYKAHENSVIKTFRGATPLQMALLSAKNMDMAEMLLKNGFKIDELNSNGLSTLTAAVITKKDDAIEWLVRHKANVNVLDYRGRTPLMYALEQGDEGFFVYLVNNGASLQTFDLMNATPLGLVKTVLRKKERAFDSDNMSDTELVDAEFDIEDLEFLADTLTRLRVPEKPTQAMLAKRSPADQALSAVMRQDTVKLKELLDAGVPVETRNLRGETLVQMAVRYSDIPTTDILIGRGADINTVNNFGNDAFMDAVSNNRLKSAILVYHTGKFTRYLKSPMPNNTELKSVIYYMITKTAGGAVMSLKYQAIFDKLTAGDRGRYGLLLTSSGNLATYNKEYGLLHKTVLDLEQLYEQLPASDASALFSEAVALKDSSYIYSLWNRATNLDRRSAFVAALRYGNTGLAKELYATGKTGVDVNAKTEYATGTNEKFTLYHHFANKYNVKEGNVISVLLTLIEMGDTSHKKKVRQLFSTWKEYGEEGLVLKFIKDAQDMSVEELKKNYSK